MRRFFWPIVFVVIAVIVIFGGAIVSLYTNWLWFSNLGYGTVFSTILLTKIKLGLLFGFLFFIVIYGNLWYARRIAPPPSPMSMEQQLLERLGRLARRGIGLVLFVGSIIISMMVGLEATTHWEEWLMFKHATSFSIADPKFHLDPIFHNDFSFYVFKLPFISYLYHWLLFALFAALIASAALHYADEAIEYFGGRIQFAPKVKAHLSILVAALFFLWAVNYRLAMYRLLTTPGSLFDGASYADIHARVPALWIMIIVSIIAGILTLLNIYRRGINLVLTGLVLVVASSIVIGGVYPSAVQRFDVDPNQMSKERPYIRRAIRATQNAYGLGAVAAREFAADTSLTADQANANTATVENIRLWDQNHLQKVYNQIQTIQQYYHFKDLDVDRYWITDPNTNTKRYRQVWLSARELDQNRLPDNAQTWVNKYLQYTHGYGFAMSPVNEVTPEGMPTFFVSDIPPVSTANLPLKKMGIYFGEMTDNNVFIKTSSPEFDYPTGGSHEATRYDENAGIRVGGFFRKLLFALQFQDYNILLSDNLKPGSRILFGRNISERTEALLPFINFDADPYLVTANGRLYWMRDGYTATNAYPYSKHVYHPSIKMDGFNYIRNSVKVVVDAYNGKVDAYIVEKPFNDPLIRTYAKMFPGIFKPISKMPAALREHTRYPEDLFSTQTQIYTRYHYHESNPDGFYRNDDLWNIPNKANLTESDENESSDLMEPYYVIMKLPNGSSEEFILMTPYVRSGERKNMVAWICAKCDSPDYGRLVLFNLPEKKSVDGPQQIAARATQDTTISQQLSLWNQSGSSVGSGNLLVIPVEKTFLYVMPVYLVSSRMQTQIPELKRVIVALGNNISMQPTLADALSAVLGGNVTTTPTTGAKARPSGKAGVTAAPGGGVMLDAETKKLINQAVNQYNDAQQALKNGNWAEYGKQTDALNKTLQQLKQKGQR